MDAGTVAVLALNLCFMALFLWLIKGRIDSVVRRFQGAEQLAKETPHLLRQLDYDALLKAVPLESWLDRLAAHPVGRKGLEAAIEAACEGIYESTKAALAGKSGAEKAAQHKAFGKVVSHITDTMGITPILNAIGLDPKANPTGVMQLTMQFFGPQINQWLSRLQAQAGASVAQATGVLVEQPPQEPSL